MAGNRFIEPARMRSASAPAVITGVYTSGSTFLKGALLVINSSGELAECGADPTLVNGVALEAAGSHPGYNIAGGVTQVTGRTAEVSYVPADAVQVFSMRGVNGGTDPSTPALTNIGESYGALKDANGIWTLDLAETTTLVFTIVDIDIDQKIFYCVFNAAALA